MAITLNPLSQHGNRCRDTDDAAVEPFPPSSPMWGGRGITPGAAFTDSLSWRLCLGGAAHAGVDQALVAGAFGNQVPTAHPLIGALELRRWIRSWLHVAQARQVEICGG
jgi:hypothetical protein